MAVAGNASALPRPAARSRGRQRSANDQIQIAIIGAGGMGVEDVKTALTVDGVRLVAVCDLYGTDMERPAVNGLW